MTLTLAERLERLDFLIAEDRLVRQEWLGKDEDGRETACLLVALSPEVGEKKSVEACPVEVMPMWLAHLTPPIDDHGSIAAWSVMVKRFAGLAHRWHVLGAAAWDRLKNRWLVICLDEAESHIPVDKLGCRAAVQRVREVLLAPVVDVVALQAAAWAVAEASAMWGWTARYGVASVCKRWSMSPEWANEWAWAWISVAAEVAEASSEKSRVATAKAEAWEKAWDRVTVAFFDAMEAEIQQAEQSK